MSRIHRRPGRVPARRVVCLITLMISVSASAAVGDFDATGRGWNGLSHLLETAAEARVEVDVHTRLDFATLDVSKPLFIVAPKVALDVHGRRQIERFLAAGGRVIIADDFRRGRSWMAVVGIEVALRPGPAPGYQSGLSHLPTMGRIEEPELAGREGPYRRFLGYEVVEVVLNHPAALIAAASPVAGYRLHFRGPFEDGVRAWMIEATSARGRMLAISDSSLFINMMLRRFHGNKQLAANVLRYYCGEKRSCSVMLVSNVSEMTGTFAPSLPADGVDNSANRKIRETVRHGLKRAASIAAAPALAPIWWAVVLLGLSLPLVWASRLPSPILPRRMGSHRSSGVLARTVRKWVRSPGFDYSVPARRLALDLANDIVRTARLASHGSLSRERALAEVSLETLPEAIDLLVKSGRLSQEVGDRVNNVIVTLQQVAAGELSELNRPEFTQLAVEVEWAKHVLSHTSRPR